MGTFRSELSDEDRKWINQQKLFFVGSAPLSSSGRVNLSPKGYNAFRILSPNQICYLDLTGSGVETITHLHENGRMTIMFAAFEGAPKIVRLWCKGTVYPAGSAEFVKLQAELYPEFVDAVGVRSIIAGDILEVGQSCGFGVPMYEFKEPRQVLINYWGKKSPELVEEYWSNRNAKSIDGIPSLLRQPRTPATWLRSKLNSWQDSVGPLTIGLIAGAVISAAILKSNGLTK